MPSFHMSYASMLSSLHQVIQSYEGHKSPANIYQVHA